MGRRFRAAFIDFSTLDRRQPNALRLHIAGMAGIFSGILLAGEFTLFMASGWAPEVVGDPVSALSLLKQDGTHVRWALDLGGVNLVALTVFFAGLAGRCRPVAYTRTSATHNLGLTGVAGHGLVPWPCGSGFPPSWS